MTRFEQVKKLPLESFIDFLEAYADEPRDDLMHNFLEEKYCKECERKNVTPACKNLNFEQGECLLSNVAWREIVKGFLLEEIGE